jgi:hypothetical protein
MPSVGAFKALCLCGVLAGSCAGQKANPEAAAGNHAGNNNDIRPAIFQKDIARQNPLAAKAQIVAAPGASSVQFSAANFHPASEEEIDGMERTLEQYVSAFESLSVPQVKQVWPDLDQKHTKALKDVFAVFKGSSAPRLGLQCAIPKVGGDVANVECLETMTYHVGKGKTQEAGPAKISIQMRGQSGHWVVQDMKGAG